MDTSLPLVDVIIPLFGIGPVFSDTLLSVLNQDTPRFRLRCTVVVDGCKFGDSTRLLLKPFLQSEAYDLHIVFQKNQGVVQARNTGIDFILSLPECAEYVLFFDGDDVLPPNYIASSITALNRARATHAGGSVPGWAYTNQLHFGDTVHWMQYPATLWHARFALNNLSQPSCLIHISLLTEAGLRFDPEFNLGIEDWDFWCAAVSGGFAGVSNPESYVRYRRLLGSRSSVNRSNDGQTKFHMTRKHGLGSHAFCTAGADVFPRVALLAERLSHSELCAYGLPENTLQLNIAADNPARLEKFLQRLVNRYRENLTNPYIFDTPYFPDMLIVGKPLRPWPSRVVRAIYAAEMLFAISRGLGFIQIREADEVTLCAVKLSALYNANGTLIRDPEGALIDVNWGKITNYTKCRLTDDFESRAQISEVVACAPSSVTRHPSQLERRVLGSGLADHSKFFTHALGYLPAATPADLGVMDDDRLGVLVPADGKGIDIGRIAADVAEQAGHARPVLFLFGSQPDLDFCKDLRGAANWWLQLSVLEEFFHKGHGTSRSYLSFDLKESDLAWHMYVTGLLSICTRFINFGNCEATNALGNLKRTGRLTEAVYVPRPDFNGVTEIQHLAAYSGVYSDVEAESHWRTLARASGVPLARPYGEA